MGEVCLLLFIQKKKTLASYRPMSRKNSSCHRISSTASGNPPLGVGRKMVDGLSRASSVCNGPATFIVNPAFHTKLISPLALRSVAARSTTEAGSSAARARIAVAMRGSPRWIAASSAASSN